MNGISVGFGIGIQYPIPSGITGIVSPGKEEDVWMFDNGDEMLWGDGTKVLITDNE